MSAAQGKRRDPLSIKSIDTRLSRLFVLLD